MSAAGFLAANALEAYPQKVSPYSTPSNLKITDLRVLVIGGAPMTCPLIRIDTNQGIYGLGEVRDGGSKNYALLLKSRLLRENPCNVDKLFRKLKQFGSHGRQGGGVSAVEMALWDLAGKAYGVPVYQMLGGKFRDRIRCYADTTESHDPKIYGERLRKRREQGFTWLKMDLGIDLIADVPGAISMPAGTSLGYSDPTVHMFTGTEVTDKGIALMCDYVAQIREITGMDIPLSADHFGHIGVNSCIRLGKALQKYNLAWLEDMIPWQYTDLLEKIASAVDTPILTGEDIYLKEPFLDLCRRHAVDIIQPDLMTSGGILETKKIGDAAQELGVPMALHCAGTPVACMANVHCAAATENFLVLENHSVDVPWWGDLVEGVDKPVIDHGFIRVPEAPGLGITLNEDVVRRHLAEPGYFAPTPQWDSDRTNDRQWS
ncbi:MAG TPA: mandelate racemase/muconate lactonizing enzyme family protein [Bryobacteraceae bacterium]|nr:mandelate racemase/muconate lactonizing enzyme family protein [Bryobacteraceae bacterium]